MVFQFVQFVWNKAEVEGFPVQKLSLHIQFKKFAAHTYLFCLLV